MSHVVLYVHQNLDYDFKGPYTWKPCILCIFGGEFQSVSCLIKPIFTLVVVHLYVCVCVFWGGWGVQNLWLTSPMWVVEKIPLISLEINGWKSHSVQLIPPSHMWMQSIQTGHIWCGVVETQSSAQQGVWSEHTASTFRRPMMPRVETMLVKCYEEQQRQHGSQVNNVTAGVQQKSGQRCWIYVAVRESMLGEMQVWIFQAAQIDWLFSSDLITLDRTMTVCKCEGVTHNKHRNSLNSLDDDPPGF